MLGPRQEFQAALFYEFNLEDHVPDDHLLRSIDRFVDLSDMRAHLRPFYSDIGRPSVDPELMIRMLLIGYIIYLRATLRSIGGIGVVLVLALVGAILWVLYDLGVLDVQNSNLNTWLGLLALSIVLGVGLSWSHVRRALSGQADMDDVDE